MGWTKNKSGPPSVSFRRIGSFLSTSSVNGKLLLPNFVPSSAIYTSPFRSNESVSRMIRTTALPLSRFSFKRSRCCLNSFVIGSSRMVITPLHPAPCPQDRSSSLLRSYWTAEDFPSAWTALALIARSSSRQPAVKVPILSPFAIRSMAAPSFL
ncbi:Uncharacterised protein [Mycobacteroides abscessus subsp. abscessus]|nr:Uncharacterised protein [Mycobacteroides abscessus subsp. abscessus]